MTRQPVRHLAPTFSTLALLGAALILSSVVVHARAGGGSAVPGAHGTPSAAALSVPSGRISGALRFALSRSRRDASSSNTSSGAGPVELLSTRFLVDADESGPRVMLKAILDTGSPEEIAELRDAGAEIHGQVGRIVSFRAPISSAEQIAGLPHVRALDIARRMKLELDKSVPETKADVVHDPNSFGALGAGVLVADIDTGQDLRHADFRDSSHLTRFKSVYNLSKGCTGKPPVNHTHGCYFTQTQINSFLKGSGSVSYSDPAGNFGHGTHTMGIAAGNGLGTGKGFPAGRYVGMAPKADLIGVKIFNNRGTQVGDVTEALQFLTEEQARLGNPPLVVNMSFGHQFGAHDGSDPDEVAMDTLAQEGDANHTPRIFVKSAGNSEQDGIYETATASLSTPNQHTFTIPSVGLGRSCGSLTGRGNDEMFADMWYHGNDDLTVRVTAPNQTTFFENRTGNDPNNFEKSTPFGTIFVDCPLAPNSVNMDRECIFGVDDTSGVLPAAGQWTVSITGNALPDGGKYDIWIADATKGNCTWGWDNPSAGSSVSIPGTSKLGITVGAYITKTSWENVGLKMIGYNDPNLPGVDNIAPFSSTGPTRDGRVKPDIAAPGMGIASTKSSSVPTGPGSEGRLRTVEDGKHMVLEGTSMSAPHVTGAAALLLSINPGLDSVTLHDIITDNAALDTFTGGVPNPIWGFGKLDVLAAASDPRTAGTRNPPMPTPPAP